MDDGRRLVEYFGCVARPKREWIPGSVYHVFARGSNRQALFRYDSDKSDLLDCLTRVVARYDLACLAFALMPNHCHYLFRIPDDRFSSAIRELHGRYAQRFNRRYGREAHLFRNRFGAVVQESDEQLIWTARYIVVNPVTAGLCAHPGEWPWTSFRATAQLEPAPTFLSVGALLLHFGDPAERAVDRYIEFVTGADRRASV